MNDPFFARGPANRGKRKNTDGPNQQQAAKRRKTQDPHAQQRKRPNNNAGRSNNNNNYKSNNNYDNNNTNNNHHHHSKVVEFDDYLEKTPQPTREPKFEENEEEEEDPFAKETADEKKARLAKEILKGIQERAIAERDSEDEEEERAREEEHDPLHQLLMADVMKGRLGNFYKFRNFAKRLAETEILPSIHIKFRKVHQLAVTAVAVTEDESFIFSGSKDTSIIKWDTELNKLAVIKGRKARKTGRKKKAGKEQKVPPVSVPGHKGHVYGLDVSSDGLLLASGGQDKMVKVWDTSTHQLKENLKGHRDYVSGVKWRHGTHDLYTASADRTIKVWDGDTLAYIDTLFGHQSPVTGIDCFRRDRCVSSSSDITTRLWKIQEQTNLKLTPSKAVPIDCVAFVTDETWVTGSQDGTLHLWHFQKRKPVCTVTNAHGEANWISAVGALRYSDIMASGSCDGSIKLWRVTKTKIEFIKDVPMLGWINSLAFTSTGKYLIVGVGQEHKMGRWNVRKEAKNGVARITLLTDSTNTTIPDTI